MEPARSGLSQRSSGTEGTEERIKNFKGDSTIECQPLQEKKPLKTTFPLFKSNSVPSNDRLLDGCYLNVMERDSDGSRCRFWDGKSLKRQGVGQGRDRTYRSGLKKKGGGDSV